MARRSRRSTLPADLFDRLDGPITDEIDLHGLTAAEARLRVQTCLELARKKMPGGLIHIITGKGKNSAGRPVLKGLVRTLLTTGKLPQVATWGLDLGEGGFLVRLKGGRF